MLARLSVGDASCELERRCTANICQSSKSKDTPRSLLSGIPGAGRHLPMKWQKHAGNANYCRSTTGSQLSPRSPAKRAKGTASKRQSKQNEHKQQRPEETDRRAGEYLPSVSKRNHPPSSGRSTQGQVSKQSRKQAKPKASKAGQSNGRLKPPEVIDHELKRGGQRVAKLRAEDCSSPRLSYPNIHKKLLFEHAT